MKNMVRYSTAIAIYIAIYKAYEHASANPINTNGWYFLVSFAAFALMIMLSAYEIAEKNITNKKSGDKLKIKAQSWGDKNA